MIVMVLKMTAMVVVYILLTLLMWKTFKNNRNSLKARIIVGLVYGLASILSTHLGVQYNHMVLNIRDVGPLTAGLFFDPVAGILAGVIGGIERYIAGTFWGIGVYTTLACSISTMLAGFLAAFLQILVLKKKIPYAIPAFFIGAVMEVFHMYAVFITHRDDMNMAFYVVKNCSVPMVLFSGVALALITLFIRRMEGKKILLFHRRERKRIPLAQLFQRSLIVVSLLVLVINFFNTYFLETQSARQESTELLSKSAATLRSDYRRISDIKEQVNQIAEESALTSAYVIIEEIEEAGGAANVDANFMEHMRMAFDLEAVNIVDSNGLSIVSAGSPVVYTSRFWEVIGGEKESQVALLSDSSAAVGVRFSGGMVQAVISIDSFADIMNVSNIRDIFSNFQIGKDGTFDVIRNTGIISLGNHADEAVDAKELKRLQAIKEKVGYIDNYYGVKSLCWKEKLVNGSILIVTLPLTEVYENRDTIAYETGLADILLFAVLYAAIFLMVQFYVVRNLNKVNVSLGKITAGDLDEVVDVRTSSEFNSLSDDINKTVDALKGYTAAAQKRMQQDLEYARVIQESALPRNFDIPRKDFNIYAQMHPAKVVGGDFYDFFVVAPDVLALVIADVSGKGIPASLFMMRSKTLVQNLAKMGKTPSEILSLANNALCEGNESETFVTVWIGIVDLKNGKLFCSNGGHEYPVLMHAGGDYELYQDKHGLVLAAMENVKYSEYEIDLNPGDRLFVYTDGIPEAINENTEQYGTERLCEALNRVKDASAEETLKAVSEDVAAFVGNAEQFDDITMMCFFYNGYHDEPMPENIL